MELNKFQDFVQITAQNSGHSFTLDAKPIDPKDLAEPSLLLPMVVAYINSINRELSPSSHSHLELIRQADPDNFALGWEVKELPSIPPGAILYFANHVIRKVLAEPPAVGLPNPTTALAEPPPGQPIELRPHLDHLGLSSSIKTPAAEAPSY